MNIFLVYLYLDILFKNITTYKSADKMGFKKERFKRIIWYGVFIALVILTITQLKQSFDSWDERPFDTIVENIPKQSIPYPSVTVCPSGIVWHRPSTLFSYKNYI